MLKFKQGGIITNDLYFITEHDNCNDEIKFKTITKKRFIKLLMGYGYQRNVAQKMHEKYIQQGNARTKSGLFLLIHFHMPKEVDIYIDNKKIKTIKLKEE